MADIMPDKENINSGEMNNNIAETTLDLVHLSRQTMGDCKLEQEILVLFQLQCESCDRALQASPNPERLAEIAHQIKGCAKAVGAWDIAQTAGLLEKNPDNKNLIPRLQDQIHWTKQYLKSLTKSAVSGEKLQ